MKGPVLLISPTDADATVIDKINVMLKMYEVTDFRAEFKASKKGSWRPFKLHHKARSSYSIKAEDRKIYGRIVPIRHFETSQALAEWVQEKILSRVQNMREQETA